MDGHRDWHAERYGYARSNVELRAGYVEDLAAVGIGDASVDVVVSNCVVNLSTDKDAVFSDVYRVLKPGGRFVVVEPWLTPFTDHELVRLAHSSLAEYAGFEARGAAVPL